MKTILMLLKFWFGYNREYKKRMKNNHSNEAKDFDYTKYGLTGDYK
jgi:hypothetical protein